MEQTKKQSFWKRLKFILQLWDGVWSIPFAMLLFCGSGLVLQWFFTDPNDPQGGPGFYDPSYIQAAFYATAIQVFLNTAVMMGLYFNFRGLFRYFYGAKDTTKNDGSIINKCKDDFQNLKSWQRIVLFLFVLCFLSGEWLLLFSKLL